MSDSPKEIRRASLELGAIGIGSVAALVDDRARSVLSCLPRFDAKDRASAPFENMLRQRHALGLLSEDIAPGSDEAWSNFPPTYSMVGRIHAALRLSRTWEDAL